MKVLLVSEYFPPKIFGGGEISARNLARALSKKGIEVTVLTSKAKNAKTEEEIRGTKIKRLLKTGNDPFSIKENLKRKMFLQKSIRKEVALLDQQENFDIIHFLNTTAIPKFKLKKKTFATINSFTNFCPKRNMFYKEKEECDGCNPAKFVGCIASSKHIGKMRLKWYLRYNPCFWALLYCDYLSNRRSLKNIDKFTPISNYLAGLLKKHGVKAENTEVIPNIVDVSEFRKQKATTGKTKKTRILYIGDYTTIKGPMVLLEALRSVEKYECDFYGEGLLEEEMKNFIRKYKLKVKVHERERYEEIPRVMKEHDLIVFPSAWPEPFGRVAIEAMAADVVIIASAAGGLKEIIKKEQLFRPSNSKELSEKIKDFVKHPKKEKLSEEAEEKYSEETIAKKMMEAYKR